MGWGYRRSVSFGGVRFTFSKSGISTSVGGRGFRLTSGPRGVYVTAGAGGFYYRQRIGGGGTPSRDQSSDASASRTDTEAPYGATRTFASADVDSLSGVSQEEFVSSLNEWTSRGHLQVITAIAAAVAIATLYLTGASPRAGVLGACYAIVVVLLVRYIEIRRRRFLLIYDLAGGETATFEGLNETVEALAGSGCFRGVKILAHNDDWKRSGGATRSLSFEGASLRRLSPPYVVTNLTPWRLATQGLSLYFFPDRILIRKGGRFAAVAYSEIQIDCHTGTFVWEESVPRDAEVIGSTWQYVRRDGGPDRRFNNNRQIPLVRVDYLNLKSATGLEIVLQSTRCSAVNAFVGAHGRYVAAGQTLRGDRDASAKFSGETQRALATLGLTSMPTADALKKAYWELAQRNHPDRYESASRDIRVFAHERMKEVNLAYEVLLPMAGDPSSPATAPAAPDTSPVSTPVPGWRSPEARAAVLAIAVCIALFFASSAVPLTIVRAEPEPTRPPIAPVATAPMPAVALPRERILYGCPLRSEPLPGASKVARIAGGTEVEIVDVKKGWKKIRLDVSTEGWTGPVCWKRRTSKQPPPAGAPEEQAPDDPAQDEDRSVATEPSPQGKPGGGFHDPFAE